MHLLVIILQQLLGLLRAKQKAPQPEVVRRDDRASNAPQADACQRLELNELASVTSAPSWQALSTGRATTVGTISGHLGPPGAARLPAPLRAL